MKGKIPLIIGIVLGLIAALVAYFSIKKEKEKYQKGWELGQVLVVSKDVKAGEKLTNDMLTIRPMPKKFITNGMIKPNDRGFIVGQPVITDIQRGDPLFYYDIEKVNVTEGLSKIIQKGGRAVSIRASETSAVGYWIRPNDHIDIIGMFRDPNTRQQIAMTLLENVIVIATGEYTGENFKTATKGKTTKISYSTITLYVLPQEAEILILAQEMGSLYFTLRNEDDLSMLDEKGKVTLDTIFTGERAMEMAVIRQKMIKQITIIRGENK
ncbi:Flp pilus assembly protein CpaB [bacterium]|nr:Flp pilus assembly protein CpaB [bacterium]